MYYLHFSSHKMLRRKGTLRREEMKNYSMYNKSVELCANISSVIFYTKYSVPSNFLCGILFQVENEY